MSFLLAFAALSTVQSPAQAEPLGIENHVETEEIVVTAERLKKFRASVKTRKKTGEPYCRVKRSSGNRVFDDGLCAAMLDCHRMVSRSDAVTRAQNAKAPKEKIKRIWVETTTMCMRPFFEGSGLD